MVEIDDLLEKGQASSKVDEVVKVGVVFAQGEVVDDEFSAGWGEGLGGYRVLVLVLSCSLKDLGDAGLFHWVLL